MKKEKIILIGGGGHCNSVIDVIELEDKYKILGIVDKEEFLGKELLGYKIIGSDNDLEEIFKKCKNAVVTVGQIESHDVRTKIFNNLKKIGFNLPVIVSPLAYVSKHSFIGEGSLLMHHVVVNANAKIGKNCIINTKALVEHDVIVEDFCHISTSSTLNGGVRVKEGTFFGSNATSRQYIKIDGFIKAGSIAK